MKPARVRALAFAAFAAVALFFLAVEHRAHLYGWLPFLLVAACALMHLFHGHGRHGAHRGHEGHDESGQSRAPTDGSHP